MIWCVACRCAVAWSLIIDAESPATLFELLYVFFPDLHMRIGYDNACQFLAYALNRDPVWAGSKRVFIDDFHGDNHTACARSFIAGALCSPALPPPLVPCIQICVACCLACTCGSQAACSCNVLHSCTLAGVRAKHVTIEDAFARARPNLSCHMLFCTMPQMSWICRLLGVLVTQMGAMLCRHLSLHLCHRL